MSRPAAVLEPPFKLFINKLGEDNLGFILRLREKRAAAKRLAPPTLVETLEEIEPYIERVTGAMRLPGIDKYKSYDFGMALREVIANGVKHPLLQELPYRPRVDSYLLSPYVWATVTEENPGFDPHNNRWQSVPDPVRLLEPNGRGVIFIMDYADFSAWARLDGEPWTHYVAVAYEQPR
jgi:hypothetical protein